MSDAPRCNLCDTPDVLGEGSETALVRSNVRAFRDERFPVWRCRHCRSIHAAKAVDLAHYYRAYPFYRQKYDLMTVLILDNLLRRLRRAGMTKEHRILDYGCGSGLFVRHLRKWGYRHAVGYDAYSPEHADPTLLERRYDCIVAQDVVEHVDDPRALLARLGDLAEPGALISIGTPNAAAVDLSRPDDYVHTLHQPYHVHLLSKDALVAAGARLGWKLVRYHPRQYSNTLCPFLNQRFYLYYARCFDDTMDLAFDGPRWSWKLLSPWALVLALFGWFFSEELDVMAVFRA